MRRSNSSTNGKITVILEHYRYDASMVYDPALFTKIQNVERMCGQSPKMLWAKENQCHISRQRTTDYKSGEEVIVFITRLSDIQATEFNLRF